MTHVVCVKTLTQHLLDWMHLHEYFVERGTWAGNEAGGKNAEQSNLT